MHIRFFRPPKKMQEQIKPKYKEKEGSAANFAVKSSNIQQTWNFTK